MPHLLFCSHYVATSNFFQSSQKAFHQPNHRSKRCLGTYIYKTRRSVSPINIAVKKKTPHTSFYAARLITARVTAMSFKYLLHTSACLRCIHTKIYMRCSPTKGRGGMFIKHTYLVFSPPQICTNQVGFNKQRQWLAASCSLYQSKGSSHTAISTILQYDANNCFLASAETAPQWQCNIRRMQLHFLQTQ